MFYLKTVLAVWDCSPNADGFTYLDAQPEVRCEQDWIDPITNTKMYYNLLMQSTVGMAFYTLALGNILTGIFGFTLCACCCKKRRHMDDDEAAAVVVDRGGAAGFAKVCISV